MFEPEVTGQPSDCAPQRIHASMPEPRQIRSISRAEL
jgi:hypothetical protein